MTGVRVILASASPRRRELLNLVGIAHETRPANVDESLLPDESPVPHAERLARAKAAAISKDESDAVIIGADTIVVIDGKVLGKPENQAQAHAMLRQLSGRTHKVFTAIAVAFAGAIVSDVVDVEVTFRDLNDSEIGAYIVTGEPMDKAGAYGIQGYGATIVDRINGDYFAVMGLSLVRLIRLMRRLGIGYSFELGLWRVTAEPR